jgi:hypothetical protein
MPRNAVLSRAIGSAIPAALLRLAQLGSENLAQVAVRRERLPISAAMRWSAVGAQ